VNNIVIPSLSILFVTSKNISNSQRIFQTRRGNNNMSSKNNNKNSKNKTTASNNAPYSTTRNRRSTQKAKKLPSAIKYSFNDLPIDIMNAVIDCMTTPTFLQ